MTDEELKRATIFDFTDDIEILEDITGAIPDIDGEKGNYLHNATLSAKAMDLFTYAERTENKGLIAQLETVFGQIVADAFNE